MPRSVVARTFASIRRRRPSSPPLRSTRILSCALLCLIALPAVTVALAQPQHTDPLNLDPRVHDAQQRFYNLDYEGALSRFEAIQRDHPQSAMAADYVLTIVIFRELYNQDLLDTTYYAHDNFLTTKRTVTVAPATRQRIEDLTNQAIALSNQQLAANPRDANAFFERGYARGLHAAFITLADHSFAAAARQGYAARNDSEQALKIDPAYADAEMAIGIQQFAVASLPRLVRMVVGIFGVGGNKQHGLQLLQDAAAHGIVTPVDSRTVLSLFLRHDGRYPEAVQVQHGLATEYPHDYLFRLEEGNLTKDEGHGPAAIAIYKQVLADAQKPGYFVDPRLQLVYFGLADTQRGQNDIPDAARNYLNAAEQPNCSDWLRKRAQLNAAQMFDLLHNRTQAVQLYQMAAAPTGDQSQADAARRYLNHPYTGK
jgi:tetratricopeptide (TPR) repeat protein